MKNLTNKNTFLSSNCIMIILPSANIIVLCMYIYMDG